MERDINWFVDQGLLIKTPFIGRLAQRFLDKARDNLVTMSILFDLHDNIEARKLLKIPEDYDSSEWVVVCGYYAMYMAALGALAKVGYRSKNHAATVVALEAFFVKKQLLVPEHLRMLERAQLEREQIEHLRLAKERREIAQYSVTKETTRSIAQKIKADAYLFVEKIEELVDTLRSRAQGAEF
jgi:uncharacterized protein (UPF0332 family)